MKQINVKTIEKEIKTLSKDREIIQQMQEKLFVKDNDLQFSFDFITDRIEILKSVLENKYLCTIQ